MPNRASGTWRVLPGRMSQMFPLLFLGNGWTDCAEIFVFTWGPISYSSHRRGGVDFNPPRKVFRDSEKP